MSTIRVDIQVLRGLAVLFVVLEHLAIPGFHYGYLGVDIFFVISGFLITSIVSRGLARDKFSFKEFYLRRAKRLLPASFVTILATIIAAKLFLPPMQIESLKQQIIGALTFSTNFVLLSQAGYFDLESATKPLLHMWSLAVEEQFYFFVPALLAFTPARHWRKILVVLAIASFVGCLYLSLSNQSAAFYLLPTRAWELLIGSIASMLVHSAAVKNVTSKLAVPAFAVLLASPFVNSGLSHPGLDAVVVCFATAIVLLANHRLINSKVWTPIEKAGDISYSLYLVHWPIIAIANASIGTESMTVKATLLAASLVTAIALYNLVEKPFRVMQYGFKPSLVVFPALTLALFGLSHSFLKVQSAEKIEKLFAPNYGLDRSCGTNIYKDTEKCRTSQDPKIIVWGDSYAMHNIPGLSQAQKIDIRQATRSACAPFLNTAPNTKRSDFEAQARQCVGFNDSTFKFISDTPSIKTVILAGSYGQYMQDTFESISFDTSGVMQIEKSTPERAMKDMQVVVEKLKALGKQVVIISPPPPINTTIVSCIQAEMASPSLTNQSSKCLLDRKLFERSHKNVLNLMKYAETSLGAKVIYLSDALCDAKSCKTIIDGVPIYRDPGHLSNTGSVKLYQKMPNILAGINSNS
ncbi:acyltransferase [Pseudomonas sp. SWRI59]|uniref:acyltransferase family protein n=1 Tax=Pseudomonas TaxID=286 RepID=UPI001648C8C1|nr:MULTISPECIES: acyltransferase family protein [unclassified Pseudomonas]MBC3504208.1 acyltransferase [Pseudomonas sp. SWRI59]MBC3509522.1 acyltransferase [Pseudomonas sp. SWRI68]